jgi:hypothetical protein
MKESLKNFLKERLNLSDEDLEKLDRGERPDDSNVLRKGDDALRKAAIRKEADEYVASLPEVKECFKLLDDIKSTLDRVSHTPDPRNPRPYFAGATQQNGSGGYTIEELLQQGLKK